ncbi:haloacid dehalogenase-like hydrolase [Dactylosporangium vinaceum]|uniref:HAD family hydrolase n=1 Tax=Dactylosporangium vinaceum TaxID=53362 RepID=A0ABV5MJP4_9ACTN|nr:haloacid dehalogenase-like hydrolase [Dactylosporangium vinaceum]UAB93733.1 haloacid dehalogenase-like hydrolase [Dactylosporangium vinaceum]
MDGILVLWDVDHTLVDVDGLGREAYDLAFLRRFGTAVTHQPPMAGRTDRAIAIDMLRCNGVAVTEPHLEDLREGAEAALDELAHLLPTRGRALPGAAAALAALHGQTLQSLLTGNVRRIAEVKLGPFGLAAHLDLDAGAYGWSHEVRAELVAVARLNAYRRSNRHFDRVVLIGDTPEDVGAALASGAGVVGVATGRYSRADLEAAGAHVALDDLADTDRVQDAIRRAAR